MSDYGHLPGPDPWYPDDPTRQQQGGPYPQQAQQDPYGTGGHPQQGYDPYGGPVAPQQGGWQQPAPHDPLDPHQPPYPGAPYQDGYGTGDPYGTGGHPQYHPQPGHDPYAPYDPYGQAQQQPAPGPYGDPHQQQGPYGQQPQHGQPFDPYQQAQGGYPQDGQGYQQGPPPGQQGYPQQQESQQGYARQQDPGAARHHEPEPGAEDPRPAPGRRRLPDWDDEEQPSGDDEHAFFAADPAGTEPATRRGRGRDGRDDPDDEDDDRDDGDDGRGGRRDGKRGGGRKRRGGCACLAVLLVLGGGAAGVAYVGYHAYESRFGPPPDYSGQGGTEVQVTIPSGTTLAAMGNILKQAGVVKSVEAFTKAAGDNPKGTSIQAGVYVLRHQMSAKNAVTMMLDPKAQSVLIVSEGMRDSAVYTAIDTKLGLAKGTTAAVARKESGSLGLPSWAKHHANVKDPLEGFLFPARYSVGSATKPAALLKQMVAQATDEYQKDDVTGEAKSLGKTPYQIVTIASLVQAEGLTDDDFGKISRVIENRIAKGMTLGFDSTINYVKGRSTLNTTAADTKDPSPYNTYNHQGLPPGPIGNPGHAALLAAVHPTRGDWVYFVTVKPGDTRFTANYAEHKKNVAEFNKYQREHGG
jgi:UPF0755 protein